MSEALADIHQDLQDLVGTTIADRYRIDSLLGVGGMAVVFKARHLGLKRDVAVKVLHPSFTSNPEIASRFEREAESASRLDHPNCVQVTDFGSTKLGIKFMVMQLLEGGELAWHLEDEPMPSLRVVELVVQVARGLEHAHKQGVVHRDIKPENIFITRDHAGREALKLVDFGISKIEGSTEGHKTSVGLVFGTPAYMSPEQAAGVEADSRADLYSLGIIMYQMLSGKLPFESDDPVSLVRMQVGRDPDPLPASVPPVLGAVVERLLKKDRNERFQTATELIQTLESIWPLLGGVPQALMYQTSSGPIELTSPGSGQIAIGAEISTGSHARHSTITGAQELISGPRPLMPPPAPAAKSSGGRKLLLAVGVLAVAGLAAAFVFRDGDGDGNGKAVRGGQPVSGNPDSVGDDEVRVGADALTLAQIDKLLLAGKLDDADALLGPLRDQYPEDPALLWRQGRLLAKSKKKTSQALAAYGEALEKDETLVENKDFYAELYDLLTTRKVRDEALDLALQKMGTNGHKFLLQVVNDDRRPLEYHDRQRALEELEKDAANHNLINNQLNMALDLLQAADSMTPCKAYGEAIEAIASRPDYYFYPRVEKATLPNADTAAGKREEPANCVGLEMRRDEILEMLSALEPPEGEGEGGTPAKTDKEAAGGEKPSKPSQDTPPPPKPSTSTPTKTSKATKKGKNCNKPFAGFRKGCRK